MGRKLHQPSLAMTKGIAFGASKEVSPLALAEGEFEAWAASLILICEQRGLGEVATCVMSLVLEQHDIVKRGVDESCINNDPTCAINNK